MKRLFKAIPLILITSCTLAPKEQAAADCRNEGFRGGPSFDQCVADKLEKVRKKQQQVDADSCKEYGFKPNTDAFADCLMNIDQSRIQREHELTLQDKQNNNQVTYKVQNRTAPPRPIQCHNEKLAGGFMTTKCY